MSVNSHSRARNERAVVWAFIIVACAAIFMSTRPDSESITTAARQQQQQSPRNANGGPSKLDLVFVLDSTGSMTEYIETAKSTLMNILTTIRQNQVDVNFGFVAYRDLPPQDSTFVTSHVPLSADDTIVRSKLEAVRAAGGGDGPEAVASAMNVATHSMGWRPDAVKVAVLVADAPPHGLGETGDAFPQGEPTGIDPLQVAREMAQKGIVTYIVTCEPSLSQSYSFARDFYSAVAKITGGKLVPLASAKLLSKVIIGGAEEQISLEKLMEDAKQVRDEVQREAAARGQKLNDEDLLKRSHEKLRVKGPRSFHVESDMYGSWNLANSETFERSGSLSSARKAGMAPIHHAMPATAAAAASVRAEEAAVSEDQLRRIYHYERSRSAHAMGSSSMA